MLKTSGWLSDEMSLVPLNLLLNKIRIMLGSNPSIDNPHESFEQIAD